MDTDQTQNTTPLASDDVVQNPAPVATPAVEEKVLSIEEQLEKAREAMEGPERTIKREKEERVETAKETLTRLEAELAELAGEKEKMEVAWIDLDNKRTAIKEALKPIEDREGELETEELRLENQEVKVAGLKQKQETEEKRWQTQTERHKEETEKWELQNKMLEVQEKIDQNTRAYQELLSKEDDLKEKISTVQKNLI